MYQSALVSKWISDYFSVCCPLLLQFIKGFGRGCVFVVSGLCWFCSAGLQSVLPAVSEWRTTVPDVPALSSIYSFMSPRSQSAEGAVEELRAVQPSEEPLYSRPPSTETPSAKEVTTPPCHCWISLVKWLQLFRRFPVLSSNDTFPSLIHQLCLFFWIHYFVSLYSTCCVEAVFPRCTVFFKQLFEWKFHCFTGSVCCSVGWVDAARSSGAECDGAVGSGGGRRAAGRAETRGGAPAVRWPPAAAGLCSKQPRGGLAEPTAAATAGTAPGTTGRGETAEGTGQRTTQTKDESKHDLWKYGLHKGIKVTHTLISRTKLTNLHSLIYSGHVNQHAHDLSCWPLCPGDLVACYLFIYYTYLCDRRWLSCKCPKSKRWRSSFLHWPMKKLDLDFDQSDWSVCFLPVGVSADPAAGFIAAAESSVSSGSAGVAAAESGC